MREVVCVLARPTTRPRCARPLVGAGLQLTGDPAATRPAGVGPVRGSRAGGIDVGELLDGVEAPAPVDSVPVVAARLAEMVGARQVNLLIADFSGRAVVRLTSAERVDGARSRGVEQAETVPLAGTAYDRVLRTQQADVQPVGDGARMIVPVTTRGDAIGLLELVLPRAPLPEEVADIGSAAHALAYLLVDARRHTDVFEWGMRSTPFSLAAEIQRRLLPAAFTCEAGQLTLAGWLEPADAVGGDTFDYKLDRDFLQVSITDAVGHDVAASLLATLLVGSLRNGRRKGLSLAEQAGYANDCLAENAPPGQFVTGQLLRVDLHTGTAGIVNAGHPPPLRLRGGAVGADRAPRGGAVRRAPRQDLRRAALSPPAGRPDRLPHRRHAGAQRGIAGRGCGAGRHRGSAPAGSRARAGRGGAARDRRESPGRRDDAVPGLVRRAAPRAERRAGCRPRSRLAERLTGASRRCRRPGGSAMRPGDLRPGGYRPGTQHAAGATAGRPRLPGLQFDEHGVPLPVTADVLAAFADRLGAWEAGAPVHRRERLVRRPSPGRSARQRSGGDRGRRFAAGRGAVVSGIAAEPRAGGGVH